MNSHQTDTDSILAYSPPPSANSATSEVLMDESSSRQFVYHYTSMDVATKIVNNNIIWMNKLSNTNDPREYKEWVHNSAPQSARARFVSEFDRIYRQRAYVLCLSQDLRPRTATYHHRGWGRARMWDQYGNKHRGACLILAHDALTEALDGRRLAEATHSGSMPIEYVDEPFNIHPDDQLISRWQEDPDLIVDGIDRGLVDYLIKAYGRKCTDWQSEHELRYFELASPTSRSSNMPPDHLELSLGNALRGVVVGESASESEVSYLLERRVQAPFAISRCIWTNGMPLLKPAVEVPAAHYQEPQS